MSESEQHHASQEQLSEQKDDSRKLFSFYILYLVKLSVGESRKKYGIFRYSRAQKASVGGGLHVKWGSKPGRGEARLWETGARNQEEWGSQQQEQRWLSQTPGLEGNVSGLERKERLQVWHLQGKNSSPENCVILRGHAYFPFERGGGWAIKN